MFTDSDFASPGAAYRGAPLWSWNARLSWPHLKEQIDHFRQMGMGGFHMHCRIGMDTPYLGDEFMDNVAKCVEYAKEQGMLACLYDEDRWPSGAAGGLALKGHPEYRAKHLLITPRPYGSQAATSSRASAKATRSENGRLLSRIMLEPVEGGMGYHVMSDTEPSTDLTRYVYLETNPPSAWYNGETYLDTLNPDAVAAFLRSTHDVYQAKVGGDFGGTVPTMFTDEPQHSHRTLLAHGLDAQDVFLPWTDDLADTFAQATGCGNGDLVNRVAELVWDVQGHEDEVRLRRWQFANHLSERFVSATLDQMAGWCKGAGLRLTGHLMNEPTLLSQTIAIGEAMRAYRSMDIPGVDMLCDRIELNTVKQASSVARQERGGAAWTASEIYGVTSWSMTFEKHKLLGDWQACLGINWRVHHLSPVSLKGEAKRDYPAAIAYQSPWYAEYAHVEDHFARVNLALTTGVARTRVAVIHPIESFWLCFGPMRENMPEMVARDTMFKELTEWLLYGLVDFDFIAESLLPGQVGEVGTRLNVGHCAYETVIVPNLRTIRSSTRDILNRFVEAGGRVIVLGDEPTMVDAVPAAVELRGERLGFNRFHLLAALEGERDVAVTDASGVPSKTLLYQMRENDTTRILFVSNLDRLEGIDSTVSVRGEWDVEILDTLSGATYVLTSTTENGWTTFEWRFEPAGSVLARLAPRAPLPFSMPLDYRTDFASVGNVDLQRIELSEPNVLLLDYAQFRIGDSDGAWEERTEVLRIGNIVRARLGLPVIGEAATQTWAIPLEEREPRALLTLRFVFESTADLGKVDLAIELAEGMELELDGHRVGTDEPAWWVDKDIARVRLASELSKGSHEIVLRIPFGRVSHTERIYLLGDFGVVLRGDRAVVTPLKQSELYWGDYTRQGLPFYAGNVKYHTTLCLPERTHTILHFPLYEAPVLTVEVPALVIKRTVAFAPHLADLGVLDAGTHEVVITSFGNRENAFGMLHHAPGRTHWCGPNEWRSVGDDWMDEYDVKPMGVLVAPRVKPLTQDKVKVDGVKRDRPLHVVLGDGVGGPILGPRRL